ncbi:26S proteasome regulatory subunit rpn1 [Protomyces lactucae-debilis]|uniref:26S proteasome regulatory subunit RPN1 n=1 Tax=Protomyces lactucae-debilis TaxID=2754530 RepID=A0A1Y2F2W3_PROLT|nr:26S proteasome regulatory subunit rpn1 [Protomyces lactucae-debilis]ORY78183.1 26S proteasome regulatory subunit rpn1 [Protomyces lactucae-debilis]
MAASTDKPAQQEVKQEEKLKNGQLPKSSTSKGKKKEKEEVELSEEDAALKADLEMLVERLKEDQVDLHQAAIDQLGTHIRTSTSSMTAVPKPLKFLRPHYQDLQAAYDRWPQNSLKQSLGDVLSVLAMTYPDGKRACLRYRLACPLDDPGSWGHEYVRHLATEIGEERADRLEKEESSEELLQLALQIVPFFLSHNAEADAVDLLLEVESIESLATMVDKESFAKVCLYIVSCVSLLAPPDDVAFLRTAHRIYLQQGEYPSAILLAIRLDDHALIQETMDACSDETTKKQMAFILARSSIWMQEDDPDMVPLDEALRNARLSEYYKAACNDLSLTDPRVPEDIYKSHLEPTKSVFAAGSVDSAKQNLASTFVNAFVNAGYGSDKLLLTEEENTSWIYKTKDAGQTSATASIGLLTLWDVDAGLAHIDKYLYSDEEYIKAGALLAVGILSNGVHHESDPALALLAEPLESSSVRLRLNAMIALGLAYAGSQREDICELLLDTVTDTDISMELSAFAALSLGLVFAGSCHGEITSSILLTLMDRTDEQLSDKWTRFMVLGLALLFVGKQEDAEAAIEALKAIENPIAKHAEVLVDAFAYAGTGNVLKVQKMLHLAADHLVEEEEDKEPEDLYQAFATIGIAMIAMGEDVGTEMALRQFGHLMHYSDPIIRRAVPLALGLLSCSNAQMKVFETLSRMSHDNDLDVAANAIFAMGMVGAGTNNARLAQLLRQLASYYARESNCLFMVRIAQGLLHMGKGTLSLNPFHGDRSLFSRTGLAGIMTVLISLLDAKSFILDNGHWLLYYLVTAMNPRILITLGENGSPVPVSVRVGQAVDSFGPGKPRKITGWVTQTTPVLLSYEQRAEMATEEWIPSTGVLEGIVIVRKNKHYEAD